MQINDKQVGLLAKVARSTRAAHAGEANVSILTLAAASYGLRPASEATVPTGFDPSAMALFEAIVEGAYLVAAADGVVDPAERAVFEKVVVEACSGVVAGGPIAALVADLADQLSEDGVDARVSAVASMAGKKPEHAREIVRIAALLAETSGGVGPEERVVLGKIAAASGLADAEVDVAIAAVHAALAAG